MHYEQMQLELDDGCCGRTYQEPCQADHQRVETSKLYSPNVLGSKKKMPLLCLSLKRGGLMQEFYWEEDGQLLGDLQTYNITDAPKDGEDLLFCATSMEWTHQESSLSNILQEPNEVDEKYYLSAKACQGILNRAVKRGKALPEVLQKALESQIEMSVHTS